MTSHATVMPASATKKLSAWPYFDDTDIAAVEEVLRSGRINYWTGEQGRTFEREFAAYAGCRHAVALANGTVALELALRVLGVGPGDEVITTSRTFIASASCAVMVGARPVIADVDRDSQNLTAETIRAKITPQTRAIIAVHLAGWPCDMDAILQLAREHGLKVIEDCAQAHGARYKDKPVGSMGDVGVFSFCQDKIITTGGEGGMITLNDEALWKAAWAYKDHGKSYDAVYHREHAPGFRWLHESFGTNWRMTEMQSVLGRNGLRHLDAWVKTRRMHADTLRKALVGVSAVRVPQPSPEIFHSYYKFYAFVVPSALKSGWSRDRIVEEINARGVPCLVGSCSEIYRERAFVEAGWSMDRLPVAQELGETSLMFLVHPTLSAEEMEWVAGNARSVLTAATR